MSPFWWMLATAGLSWLALWVALPGVAGSTLHPELFYGMLGPLLATSVTWIVTARAYRRTPERLTGIMVGGLAVKAVFFGVYVTVMLRGLDLRPQLFVGSFTTYFIVLYGLEALFLKRLFAGGFRPR